MGGVLYDMVYGHVAALHVDPIEKLPLYHIRPGMQTLCFATAGCGLHCAYCQNWQLSQVLPEDTRNFKLMPKDIVRLAKEEGLDAICGAYTEPLTFFEFMRDVAKEAKANGIKTYVATGGFINPEPAKEIAGLVDGFAFGFKGFSDEFYDDVIGSGVKLSDILTSLKTIASTGVHIEVVNLLLPGLNDKTYEVAALSEWVRDNIGVETPLHFLRFFPEYKMKNLPMTPPQTLIGARKTAMDVGLKYVYIGNLPGHEGNCTYCSSCGALVVQRVGLRIIDYHLSDQGKCKKCGAKVPGDFSSYSINRFG
jgi:pyruvate formate lyase activating enzyme